MNIEIKVATKKDLDSIFLIEKLSSKKPISKRKIYEMLKCEDACTLIAEKDGVQVGYLIYHQIDSAYVLHTISVLPEYRRKKIGTQLMKTFMEDYAKSHIEVLVSEYEVDLQLFLKSLDFLAVETFYDFFEDNHDGYYFIYMTENDYKILEDYLCKGK